MSENTSEREIIATRILNAPLELVWKVWTDPEHIKHWWGPNGFTNTIEKMDVRPGGIWLFTMHGPDGTDYPNKIEFTEVKKPERLRYNHGDQGKPGFFRVTVIFEALGNKTKLSMRSLFDTAEERSYIIEKYGAIDGMNQTLDRLKNYLSSFDN